MYLRGTGRSYQLGPGPTAPTVGATDLGVYRPCHTYHQPEFLGRRTLASVLFAASVGCPITGRRHDSLVRVHFHRWSTEQRRPARRPTGLELTRKSGPRCGTSYRSPCPLRGTGIQCVIDIAMRDVPPPQRCLRSAWGCRRNHTARTSRQTHCQFCRLPPAKVRSHVRSGSRRGLVSGSGYGRFHRLLDQRYSKCH